MNASILSAGLLLFQAEPEGSGPLDWVRSLEDLDLSVRWGEFEAKVTGELNFRAYYYGREAPGISVEEAALRADHYDPSRLPDGPELGGRVLLFLDVFYQDWLTLSAEFRGDRGIAAERGEEWDARVEQYWFRVSPEAVPVELQAGKFAAPVGNFIGRHAPRSNPLTTFPLPYDHVTSYTSLRDTPASVLARRDRADRKFQRVPIWEEVYAHGLMLFGGAEGVNGAVAVMNASPGSWGYDWDLDRRDFRDPTLYLRLSYAPGPAARFGFSWARGPHTKVDDDRTVPAGEHSGDFDHTLAGLDASFSAGHLDLFAEVYFSRFESPNVEDLDLWTGYVEGKVTVLPGLFAAARVGYIRFGHVDDASGASRQWDRDVARYEAGGGYFFTRNLFLKGTYQVNDTRGGRDPNDNLLMTELVLTF